MARIKTEFLNKKNTLYIIEIAEEFSNYYLYTLVYNKKLKKIKKQLITISYDLEQLKNIFDAIVNSKIEEDFSLVRNGEDLVIPSYSNEQPISLIEF